MTEPDGAAESTDQQPDEGMGGADDSTASEDTGVQQESGSSGDAGSADDSESSDDSASADDSGTTDDSGSADDSGSSDDSGSADDSGSSDSSGSTHAGPNDDSGSTSDSSSSDDASVDDPGMADGSGADEDAGGSTDSGSTDSGSTDSGGSSTAAKADPSDLGPPYLIVDQFPGDSGMNPPWATLVGRPEFYGAIIKAWETITAPNGSTGYNDGGWFAHNWPAVRDAGGARYGTSWFRGAYLFLKFRLDGAQQADAYLDVIDKAGGWADGDMLPIVDVELGGATNPNHTASKQQIIDCVSACAARLKERTHRRVMLYGRGAMRDLSITDKMGCDVVWNPSYTGAMVRHGLEAFTLDDIVLWQYCGDNQAYLPNYPHSVTGFGKIDISVVLNGASAVTLNDVKTRLLT